MPLLLKAADARKAIAERACWRVDELAVSVRGPATALRPDETCRSVRRGPGGRWRARLSSANSRRSGGRPQVLAAMD